jgi:hypothetical protein
MEGGGDMAKVSGDTSAAVFNGRRPAAWAAYAACALALPYAGGTAGLSTIAGSPEELGRARRPWSPCCGSRAC